MMKKRSMKKGITYVALIVLVCAGLVMSVSGVYVNAGSNYQLFTQKGITNQIQTGSIDTVKIGAHLTYQSYHKIIQSSAYSTTNNSRQRFTIPITYPAITPVPEQASSSLPGGIIIQGTEGDWINMRSNFYNSTQTLYDGRWHYHVGTIPAYWENMFVPGSYTIQVANKATDTVYYCETVTVSPGQTVTLQVMPGMCPFCTSC
jgi:hypothetical protein